MEGHWLSCGVRCGVFDGAVAFRRISSGGMNLMKKNALGAVAVVLLLGAAASAFLRVASAWTGLTAFFISFLANSLYVWRRQRRWDALGVSAAEVGLVFTTVV